MQLSIEEAKSKVETLLWNGEGNLLWGFCYQQQMSGSVTENYRAGYAINSVKVPTELTLIATGLYRVLDADYKPILIGEQDPWPGYKVGNETHGVDPGIWRKVAKKTPINGDLLRRLYFDFLEKAEEIYGSGPDGEVVYVLPWFQSPVDTLSALYTPWRFLQEVTFNETEVMEDLEFVTDFTIEFIKFLRKTFPHIAPYCLESEVWMPYGVSLWEDQMDLFSRFFPKGYYEKFAMPFTQRIADEFGGIALHTCGEVTHHVLDPLRCYENLIAFQYDAAQTPARRVLDALGDKRIAFIPRYSFAGMDKDPRSSIQIEHPMDYVRATVHNWYSRPRNASMFLVIPQAIDSLLIPREHESMHGHLDGNVKVTIHNEADLETIFKTLDALGLMF